VTDKGETLAEGLREIGLEGVRGRGLMLGFEIADAPDVARELLLEQRLVTNATGPTTIRLLPPLTISRDEIGEALGRLRSALS
jgi:acetylornithine/succinyldiaminopimelate/putrescine aminotransferase